MFHSKRVTCVLTIFLLIMILRSSTILPAEAFPPRTLGTPTGGYWTGPVSGALPSKIPAYALAKWGGNIGSLPASFSWSGWDGASIIGANYMTPVRDQGGCGSCWAFAAIGGMEAQYQINNANPSSGIDLSEQNVLQCSGGSCSGWYLDGALDYLKNSGTPDEACNPYNATDHPCGTGRCSDYLLRTYKITDWTFISTDTATIKSYLINHGPVMVWMPIFNDFPWWNATFWQYYYYGHGTSDSYDGHFVVVVGWNDSGGGYWIVRNSWGTSGGDVNDYGGGRHGGYFYMTMDPTTGFFGIHQEAAVISDVTEPASNTVTFYTNPTTFVGASSLGSITACGGTFTNGQSNSTSCGSSFAATADLPVPLLDWQFHHWEWSGGVSCSSDTANPASCSITGAGSLKAVYSAKVTFQTDPTTAGSISWGSCSNSPHANGQTVYEVSLPPEYVNNSITACYVPSGYTLSGWSCSGGLSCSGSNDPVRVTFTGPGTITAAFRQGSLSNPAAGSLTATTAPNPSSPSTTFTISGNLTSGGVGLGGRQLLLFLSWNFSLVSVTTEPDGSYSYTATAPSTPGTRRILVLYGGDLTGSPQYMPSLAITSITVQ